MTKILAYNWTALGQSLLDIAIKTAVVAVIGGLDALSKALSNGTFQLPDPAVTIPVLTLLVSQLDSFFVAWTTPVTVVTTTTATPPKPTP